MDKANEFVNEFFAANSNLCDKGAQTPLTIRKMVPLMCDPSFNEGEILKAINSLDQNKASGPDEIPAVLIKKCSLELAPFLLRLFTLSWNNSIVPAGWKNP